VAYDWIKACKLIFPTGSVLLRSSLLIATLSLFPFWRLMALAAPPPPVAGSAGEVAVSGSSLLRDGATWTPHGPVSIALVGPLAAHQGVVVNAYKHLSKDELLAMRALGSRHDSFSGIADSQPSGDGKDHDPGRARPV